ncbi:MAG: ABC transporter substrate-binding protein, partial [Verrucomicrobia bacterium]|nr:ABC transporter substrate-binding protein [Verrucomicrobiota bacterium]
MPAFFRAFASFLCALSLVACAPDKPRADLIFIQSAEPETIDPALASDQVSMRIATSLFEGLCRVTAEGKPEPGMAERWDISADHKTYTFHLRPGTAWSDGSAITAEDFVKSWQRVLTPETGADYANLMFVIRGA